MTCNDCGSENHFANNCDGTGPRGRNQQRSDHQRVTFATSSGAGPLGAMTFSSSAVLMITDSATSNAPRQDAEPGAGWTVPPAEAYSQAELQAPTPMPQSFNPWVEFSRRSALEASASPFNPLLKGRCARCGAELDDDDRCWRCAFRAAWRPSELHLNPGMRQVTIHVPHRFHPSGHQCRQEHQLQKQANRHPTGRTELAPHRANSLLSTGAWS